MRRRLIGLLVAAGLLAVCVGSQGFAPPAEQIPSPEGAALWAISARSPNDVWVAGQSSERPARALLSHWDGTAWRRAVLPDSGIPNASVQALTRSGERDIWAVGSVGAITATAQPLILHGDGTVWERLPGPSPDAPSAALRGLSALSPTDIWAAGDGGISHWDGRRWSSVPGVPPGRLSAIAALTPRDIWAVGGDASGPLTIHWDGATWRRVPAPACAPNDCLGDLVSVAAVASDDVWAAGGYAPVMNSIVEVPLLLHWDGRAWHWSDPPTGDSPGPFADAPRFWQGLAARAADDVWVVGRAWPHPLAAHWDGRAWREIGCPSGDPGEHQGFLAAAAAVAPGQVWAVGWEFADGAVPQRALLLRYRREPCLPATPTHLPARQTMTSRP